MKALGTASDAATLGVASATLGAASAALSMVAGGLSCLRHRKGVKGAKAPTSHLVKLSLPDICNGILSYMAAHINIVSD